MPDSACPENFWPAVVLNVLEDFIKKWSAHSRMRFREVVPMACALPFVLVSEQFRMEGYLFTGFLLWSSGILFIAVAVRRARLTIRMVVARGDAWLGGTTIPHRRLFLLGAVCSSAVSFVVALGALRADQALLKMLLLAVTFVFMRTFLFFVGQFRMEG